MKYILGAALAAVISIGHASATPNVSMLAQFKGSCLSDHGKLKPADAGHWVCFLPNGTLRVST